MSIRSSSRYGYILLEVVASIAVVAIGIAVIVRSFSYSLRASKIAQEYLEAGILLQDRLYLLAEKELMEGGVPPGESSEQPAGTPYTVNVKVEEAEGFKPLNLVEAGVSWMNKNRSEKLAVDTLIKGNE